MAKRGAVLDMGRHKLVQSSWRSMDSMRSLAKRLTASTKKLLAGNGKVMLLLNGTIQMLDVQSFMLKQVKFGRRGRLSQSRCQTSTAKPYSV